MTPSFLPLQLLSIFISFYLLSILYHSTLFEHVEQAKTSEKCYFVLAVAQSIILLKTKITIKLRKYICIHEYTTTMKVWYKN